MVILTLGWGRMLKVYVGLGKAEGTSSRGKFTGFRELGLGARPVCPQGPQMLANEARDSKCA